MDMKLFVQSLTSDEVNELWDAIYDERRALAYRNIKPASELQKKLVDDGEFIAAIKDYRYEHNSSLLEAKIAMEVYREWKKQQ
jgi:hypothetical protein